MFAAAHYAALALFVTACWGFGRMLLTRVGAPAVRDVGLEAALAATLGVGVVICGFQALAIAGMFGTAGVLGLVAAGLAAALAQAPAGWRDVRAVPAGAPLSRA